MREGKCDLCETVYEMARSDKKYCSANCRAKASQLRAEARIRKENFLNSKKELISAFKAEFEAFKNDLLVSDPIIQKERINQYWKGAIQVSEAIGSITSWIGLVEFYDILEIPLGYRLSEKEYDQITGKKKGLIAKTIDYARLTFVLSFIGFLGSIGFYFGVLREVYSPARDKQKIEVLKEQNVELQNTVNILIEQGE
ncbi:MAG: hypothetical protein GQ574_26805 [Crocinitomix sp.]|nr:hypothetical protein [Crocinitomix sp.]